MSKHTHPKRRMVGVTVFLVVFLLATVNVQVFAAPASRHGWGEPIELIVDTDPGVDDAAAIVWLLSQERYPVEVLGIATVVGNTTVDNGTNNVLTLLDVLGQTDVPVVMGTALPLDQSYSPVNSMIHGPDGLWFVGMQNPHDLTPYFDDDVAQFYCDMAVEHPGATVLALGPLTNLALAVQQCPGDMPNFGQVIVIGGSKIANAPMTDFNFWTDPEAADIVLSSGLPVTLILLEASQQLTLTEKNLQDLAEEGNAAAQLIAGPMQMSAEVQTGMGGEAKVAYYDVAAAIYAAAMNRRPKLAVPQSGLVKMVTEESLARGQTIIGLNLMERVGMIATDDDLNMLVYLFFNAPLEDFQAYLFELLAREPDNAQVVLDIREHWMRMLFMGEMTE
jgi:purine nucleosidase